MKVKTSVSLLLLSAILLVSCQASSPEKAASSSETDVISQTESAAETEDTEYHADYLPQNDYGGYEFRMISTDDAICVSDITNETGDVFDDSIYKRNRKIEDEYNLKIVQTAANSWMGQYELLKNSVLAGSDDFDLIRLIMREAFSAAQDNYILSTAKLPYCDPTKPWYIKYINDELTFGNVLPFAYTDECLGTYMYTQVIFFNKAIAANNGMNDFYQSVNDGTWTLDAYLQYMEEAIRDVNGDGNFTVQDDVYGVISRWDAYSSGIWVGSGMNTISKDENNMPYLDVNDEMYSLLNLLLEKNTINGINYDVWSEMANGNLEPFKYFCDGHSLFYQEGLSICVSLRSMEEDFGLLPIPKYSDKQDTYYSSVIDGYVNVAPTTSPDAERTSIVIEALAIESKNIVVPAYMEMTVQTKALRDNESLEMLQLILDGRKIDLGVTVWMNPIRSAIVDNCFHLGKNTFASSLEKSKNKIDETISNAIENLTGSDTAAS